jgi:4-amino-4-deoxy-L-arabinose transferase-like glycosyltransferase
VPNRGGAQEATPCAGNPVSVQESGVYLSTVAVLGIVVVIAVALRLHGLFHDLPFSYYGDELAFVKRSMSLGAGDLNPHWFNKPAFLMYLLLGCYGAFYVIGAALGTFASSEAFGAYFLYDMGPFLLIGRLVVAAFGIATVYGTFLLANKAWRSPLAGLCAAAVVACLPAMVAGSQVVKEDTPAAAFIVFSLYAYLWSRDTSRIWPLVLASGLAGLSMAIKYYGIILVPIFLLAEVARLLPAKSTASEKSTVKEWLSRSIMVVISFTAAFFIASPYNFLDRTWFGFVIEGLQPFLTGTTEVRYEPDRQVVFEIGYGMVPKAVAETVTVLARPQILGPFLSGLVLLGIVSSLWNQKTRGTSVLVLGSVGTFFVCVAMWGPYHTSPRHFIPILPLLACFTYPGIIAIANFLKIPAYVQKYVVSVLVILTVSPSMFYSIDSNINMNRSDSRKIAYSWIKTNISKDDLILLDDYGPEIQENTASVERLLAVLEQVGTKSSFTAGESTRLSLLSKFPAAGGFNISRLGHSWWHHEEISDEEMRASNEHLRMGNPLISRVPRSLAEYQQMGIDYIVTNSIAEQRYFDDSSPNDRFPSFVRFYEDLRKMDPIQIFDPTEWNGKGPIIYVYRLQKSPL